MERRLLLSAPHWQSLIPGLRPTQPWCDFVPSLPADTKRKMYFTEQVEDELMRRGGDGDSTWANLDMMLAPRAAIRT